MANAEKAAAARTAAESGAVASAGGITPALSAVEVTVVESVDGMAVHTADRPVAVESADTVPALTVAAPGVLGSADVNAALTVVKAVAMGSVDAVEYNWPDSSWCR